MPYSVFFLAFLVAGCSAGTYQLAVADGAVRQNELLNVAFGYALLEEWW